VLALHAAAWADRKILDSSQKATYSIRKQEEDNVGNLKLPCT